MILSDRGVSEEWAPIPSLLAIAAVHHHLVCEATRTEVGLILETGEPRDVHHFACLIGYGAGVVNPYLVFETYVDLEREGYLPEGVDAVTASEKFIKAINKGLLKIFSKMGISTVQSYCGAQIFEAVGLSQKLVDRYFTGTPSRVEGIGMREIGEETLRRHLMAYEPVPVRQLDFGSEIHYRIEGEHHNWNPETIYKLQHATQTNNPKTYEEFAELVNNESKRRSNLRGLFDFKFVPEPIPIEEVEPVKEIMKRFTTGAMSYGAISKEAHETLAIAMNRIGGKSNTGEGGEDAERFIPLPNGDSKNSYIKQVASGRFGVTANYLVNAKELQIKMAQGGRVGYQVGGRVDLQAGTMDPTLTNAFTQQKADEISAAELLADAKYMKRDSFDFQDAGVDFPENVLPFGMSSDVLANELRAKTEEEHMQDVQKAREAEKESEDYVKEGFREKGTLQTYADVLNPKNYPYYIAAFQEGISEGTEWGYGQTVKMGEPGYFKKGKKLKDYFYETQMDKMKIPGLGQSLEDITADYRAKAATEGMSPSVAKAAGWVKLGGDLVMPLFAGMYGASVAGTRFLSNVPKFLGNTKIAKDIEKLASERFSAFNKGNKSLSSFGEGRRDFNKLIAGSSYNIGNAGLVSGVHC